MTTPVAHTSVPPIYPVPGSVGAIKRSKILRDAQYQPFEWLHFGSSLHSFSTTSGTHYMAGLNMAFQGVYGNSWGTSWIPPASFGSTPMGQWCVRSSRPNTVDPTGLVSTYLPPNWACRKLNDASANFAFQFEPDGWAVAPLYRALAGTLIRTGETIKPWWIGWSIGQGTGEAAQDTTFGFITRKQAAGVTGAIFGGGTLLSNITTVNIPATSASTGQTFTPGSATHMARELDFPTTNGGAGVTYTHDASKPNYCLQMYSAASPTNYVLCAGARWTNETSKYGIVCSQVALGGAKVGDFAANHSNSWETLRAMCGNRRRILAWSLQTNSAYNNYAAKDDNNQSTSYYHLMKAHIDTAIANLNPDLIFLISDGTRVDGTAPQNTEYSLMVGVDKILADEYPGLVHCVNTRLVLERHGCVSANETMTGYTYRNGWAVTTAYSVGDVVGFGDGDALRYFRCLVAHTSAAGDKPELGANWQSYWRRHRQYLTADNGSGAAIGTAPTDTVHYGAYGSYAHANLAVQLIFGGCSGIPSGTRMGAR